jgi:hypothetical protein
MRLVAYVDPGTGSFVFQMVIGAILAVGVAVKVWWKKIVAFVTRRHPDQPGVAAPPDKER